MLNLFSKALAVAGRTCNLRSFKPINQALLAQSLTMSSSCNFTNSKQKTLVRYTDELKPFTINNLWANEGIFCCDKSLRFRFKKNCQKTW